MTLPDPLIGLGNHVSGEADRPLYFCSFMRGGKKIISTRIRMCAEGGKEEGRGGGREGRNGGVMDNPSSPSVVPRAAGQLV